MTLTIGSLKLDAVIEGMRKLKMRLSGPDDEKKKHVWLQDQESSDAKDVLMTLIRQKVSRPSQFSYRQVQQTKQHPFRKQPRFPCSEHSC